MKALFTSFRPPPYTAPHSPHSAPHSPHSAPHPPHSAPHSPHSVHHPPHSATHSPHLLLYLPCSTNSNLILPYSTCSGFFHVPEQYVRVCWSSSNEVYLHCHEWTGKWCSAGSVSFTFQLLSFSPFPGIPTHTYNPISPSRLSYNPSPHTCPPTHAQPLPYLQPSTSTPLLPELLFSVGMCRHICSLGKHNLHSGSHKHGGQHVRLLFNCYGCHPYLHCHLLPPAPTGEWQVHVQSPTCSC